MERLFPELSLEDELLLMQAAESGEEERFDQLPEHIQSLVTQSLLEEIPTIGEHAAYLKAQGHPNYEEYCRHHNLSIE